jgi:hypothetical protein
MSLVPPKFKVVKPEIARYRTGRRITVLADQSDGDPVDIHGRLESQQNVRPSG